MVSDFDRAAKAWFSIAAIRWFSREKQLTFDTKKVRAKCRVNHTVHALKRSQALRNTSGGRAGVGQPEVALFTPGPRPLRRLNPTMDLR